MESQEEDSLRRLGLQVGEAHDRAYGDADQRMVPLYQLIPRKGQLFAKTYFVNDLVGEGSFCLVYEVRYEGVTCIIAMLRPDLMDDPEANVRFLLGVDILRYFRRYPHTNIVRTMGDGDFADLQYVVLERLVPAFPKDALPSFSCFLEYLTSITSALCAVHEVGVVHRDVKPSNIMVRGLNAVLIDFNVAYCVNRDISGIKSPEGILVGTPGFMSPQQARCEASSPADDVFGLAATAYRSLTGVTPYPGSTPEELVCAARDGKLTVRWPSHIPAKLRRYLSAALSPEARQRPSMKKLFQALRRLQRLYVK